MSQKVSRKSAAVNEDKEKRNTDSPVKEMKKKMAANAEKEKQAAEKADKPEKSSEKVAEKIDKPEKSTDKKAERSEKPEKSSDKKAEKSEKPEKSLDKKAEKKEAAEKKNDKPEPQAEKSKEESTSKEDKAGKPEKERTEPKKDAKPKQNGRAHNGVSDVTHDNGDDVNGTVSAGSDDEDVMLVIDDHDEVFPELTYDDTSDVECFEPPTPDSVPSRSFTRRSQPKDSKVLKLKDDATSTDRKLRSADSPKPQDKKDAKEQEKEGQKEESKDVVGDKAEEKTQEKSEMEVIVEVDVNEGEEVQRKTDTNYSKSRVKVSPYRRSMRIADQTNTSNIANYTGNNTTMEMDITESSSFLEADNLDDSSYLRGLRSIRGRSSYKQLKEISLKHVNRSTRSNASANVSSTEHNRPTGTVVGRKRKPDTDDSIELATEAHADTVTTALPVAGGVKRMRVLDRLTEPFRRVASVASVATVAVTLPAAHRRNAEIVGINTDLPLSAPVASEATFDPESLKNVPQHDAPVAVPLPPPTQTDKRCVVM